jgi:glycosyltransferase involved in cell wall biosynthesis
VVTIRVAYDISVLARSFQQPADQSGVYRSIEELLYALSERDDIDLTTMGICGDDLLLDALYSSLYVRDRRNQLECEFAEGFKSRLRLEPLYRRFLGAALSKSSPSSENSAGSLYRRTMTGLLHRLHYRYGVDKVSPVVDANRYDVFHSPFLPLPANDVVNGLPKVLTIYDLIFILRPELGTPHLRSLLPKIVESVDVERDWVTCISEFTKQEFCEYTGMAPERAEVTPLAPPDWLRRVEDTAAIADLRQRYKIPGGDYFLALGTLQPRKNLNHLIRCFFKLIAQHSSPPIYLVLVGTANWRFEETFKAAAESSADFRSRVIFTGYIPDCDLSSLYSGARAFVFPSLYEGFGLPPLEAMRCGTPVIASNTTSLPEVVGDAGLLIDPTDCDELCQAMWDLLNDDKLRAQLSREGLKRSQQFSWSICAEKTVDLYRKTLQAA